MFLKAEIEIIESVRINVTLLCWLFIDLDQLFQLVSEFPAASFEFMCIFYNSIICIKGIVEQFAYSVF